MWKIVVACACGIVLGLGICVALPWVWPEADGPYRTAAADESGSTWQDWMDRGIEWLCPLDSAGPGCLARMRSAGHSWSRKPDLEKAAAWYARAAKAGDAQAMFHLAWTHEEMARDPLRAKPNAKAAVAWYRKSAEAGFPPSMNNLGVLVARGAEGRADHAAAFRWYLAAAQAGNPIGRMNVTFAYLSGRGVPHDPAEVSKWATWKTQSGVTDDLKDPVLPRTRLFGIAERPSQDDDRLRQAAGSGRPILLTVTAMRPSSARTFQDVQND